MIAGADSRVRSAFRATLQRQPYFGAPPAAPEVLCVGDLSGAIARAEAVLSAVRREPTPPPPPVYAGPSGTQRLAALTAAEADRVLRTDSILVLDEYAFNYPAGRLDTFLPVEARSAPARRTVARRALIGWLALALVLPVILTAIFVAGVGIGQHHVELGAASGNILRLPTEAQAPPTPVMTSHAPSASLPDFEARTNRFSRPAPPVAAKPRH